MFIEKSLFEGEKICLAPIDRENDAGFELKWAQDGSYLRLLNPDPALPASAERIKKHYERSEKEVGQDKNLFYFTIRLRPDDRLIGFARLYGIGWAMRYGSVQLGIGDPGARGKGYGSEALNLLLRYAFGEINLFRLEVNIPEYNLVALQMFRKAGFSEEARLIGFTGLWIADWNHRHSWVGIGLGEREFWGKGYGTDAMRLIVRYAFDELDLHRVSLTVFEYNTRAIRSYEKAASARRSYGTDGVGTWSSWGSCLRIGKGQRIRTNFPTGKLWEN